jgi:hypothetical protein
MLCLLVELRIVLVFQLTNGIGANLVAVATRNLNCSNPRCLVTKRTYPKGENSKDN